MAHSHKSSSKKSDKKGKAKDSKSPLQDKKQSDDSQKALLSPVLSPEDKAIYDKELGKFTDRVSTFCVGHLIDESSVKAAAKASAQSQAINAVSSYKVDNNIKRSEEAKARREEEAKALADPNIDAPPPVTATAKYLDMKKDASLRGGVKKTEEKAAKELRKIAQAQGLSAAVADLVEGYVETHSKSLIGALPRGKSAVKTASLKAYSAVKREVKKMAKGSRTEKAIDEATAVTTNASVQRQVVSGAVEGPLNAKAGVIGTMIDNVARENGESLELSFELTVPVWAPPPVNIVFGLGGSVERDEGMTSVGVEVSIGGQIGLDMIPGVDLGVLVKLGGYLEAEGANGAECLQNISYGFYRKVGDLLPKKVFGVEVAETVQGWMWGMGGKSGDGKKGEAAAWAAMVEEQMLESGGSVELGGLVGVEAEAKAGLGGDLELGVEAGYSGKFGTRYGGDNAKTEKKDASGNILKDSDGNPIMVANRDANGQLLGESHHTHEVSLGVSLGPIEGEAALTWEKSGKSGEEVYAFSSFEYSVGGTIPFVGAEIVEQFADPVLKLLGKAQNETKSANTSGAQPAYDKEGQEMINMAKDQVELAVGSILKATAGFEGGLKISLDGGKEAGENWKHDLVFTTVLSAEIDAGILGIEIERSRKLYSIPLIGGDSEVTS